METFGKVFGPNGVFDTFFKEKLAGLVDTSGKVWDPKPGLQVQPGTVAKTPHASSRMPPESRKLSSADSGTSPNVKFAIVVQVMSAKTAAVTFEVNGAKLESPFGVESRGDFEWPGSSPDGTASVSLAGRLMVPSLQCVHGSLGATPAVQGGAMRKAGNKATVRFVVKGRDVTYQLTFDTLDNPFTVIQQVKFACPADL